MRDKKKTYTRLMVCAALIVVAIIVALPHKTKTIESESLLQSGKKMTVKMTLQSAWGWSDPDRLAKMDVTLDGHNVPISSAAYSGSIPLKASQPPIIVEKSGFPEVIAIGKTGDAIKQANWSFQNYGLSQRQLISSQGRSDTFFAPDPTQLPTAQIQVPQKIEMSGLASGSGMKKLGN